MHGMTAVRTPSGDDDKFWKAQAIHEKQLQVADVERRMLRACMTLRALPDKERKFQTLANSWPDTVREVSEAYGYADEIMPRFRPKPSDVSDCLTALAWARGMPKRVFKLIWWRSFGVSFRHIGIRLGRSDETARMRYRDAILSAWYEAKKQEAIDNLANLANSAANQRR